MSCKQITRSLPAGQCTAKQLPRILPLRKMRNNNANKAAVKMNNEPPRDKPRGIFSVELYPSGGSFERKFIKSSGLIPNTLKY